MAEVNGSPYASPQEKLLHNLTCYGLGYHDVFLPTLYGRKGKEPADLAWKVDDVVILINCKKNSRKNQYKQDEHNLSQARDWLRNWSRGTPLKGKNDSRDFDIDFSSISKILVISVPDGTGFSCRRLSFKPHYGKLKLIAAVSIPMETLSFIFESGTNSQDLVNFINIIYQYGQIEHTATKIQFTIWREMLYSEAFVQGTKYPAAKSYTARIIPKLKNPDSRENIRSSSALGMFEIAWLDGALAAATEIVGKVLPGQTGTSFIIQRKSFGGVDIIFSAGANAEILFNGLEANKDVDRGRPTIKIALFFSGLRNEHAVAMIRFDERIRVDLHGAVSDLEWLIPIVDLEGPYRDTPGLQ